MTDNPPIESQETDLRQQPPGGEQAPEAAVDERPERRGWLAAIGNALLNVLDAIFDLCAPSDGPRPGNYAGPTAGYGSYYPGKSRWYLGRF
jgi:hypothetical protein